MHPDELFSIPILVSYIWLSLSRTWHTLILFGLRPRKQVNWTICLEFKKKNIVVSSPSHIFRHTQNHCFKGCTSWMFIIYRTSCRISTVNIQGPKSWNYILNNHHELATLRSLNVFKSRFKKLLISEDLYFNWLGTSLFLFSTFSSFSSFYC